MRFHYLSASLLASWETAGTTASSRKTNFSNFCRDLTAGHRNLQVWAPPANPWANGWAEGEELWHAVGLREDEWLIEDATPTALAQGGYSEWMEAALGSWFEAPARSQRVEGARAHRADARDEPNVRVAHRLAKGAD